MIHIYLLQAVYLNLNLIDEGAFIDFLFHVGPRPFFLSTALPSGVPGNHSYMNETHNIPSIIPDFLQYGVRTHMHMESNVNAKSV